MKHVKYLSCLILLLSITACGPKGDMAHIRTGYPGAIPGKNKVALLLPLSGPQKAIGIHLKNAAQMSLFDMNNHDFELAFYDTKAQPSDAAAVAQRAVDEGASLIIGPLFSNTSTAAYQQVRGRIPIISLSNNEAIATDGLYSFGFHVEDQIDRLFNFLAEQNKKQIVLIAPKTRYGDMVTEYASKNARQYEQNVITITYTKPDDMQEVAAQVKEIPHIDVIILPEGGDDLKLMISSLMYYDVDLGQYKLVGTGLWDAQGTKHTALIGGWYTAVDPARRRSFEEEYRALYGQKPPRIATLSYDAVAMAATLARAGNLSEASLKNRNGFEGLDGFFKFKIGGHVNRSLAVMEVRPGGHDIVISHEKLVE